MNSTAADTYRLDQAHRLRSLVANVKSGDASQLRPHLVLVVGANKDVGTSTLAASLASALAAQGCRTLLLDAGRHPQDVAAWCGLQPDRQPPAVEQLGGDLARLARPGPYGLLVLAADDVRDTAGGDAPAWPGCLLDHVLDHVQHDNSLADWVVVDAGSDSRWHAAELWQRADEVFLVTTPDRVAVIEAYAAIKRTVTGSGGVLRNIRILVNQATNPHLARDALERICRCCRRFLRVVVNDGGWIHDDASLAAMLTEHMTAGSDWSCCEANRQLRAIIDGLQARLQSGRQESGAGAETFPQRPGQPGSVDAARGGVPDHSGL